MKTSKSYYVKNDWVGVRLKDAWYMYNAVNKTFAVFESYKDLIEFGDKRLSNVESHPLPDFCCEANAAAITLTTKCNMDCGYCFVKPVSKNADMSPVVVREAINALGRQTQNELVLFAWGGEPTQNPEGLIAMLTEALKYPHIKVCLVTNGVIDSFFLDRLLSFKNLVFQISFDGFNNHNSQKPLLTSHSSIEKVFHSLKLISNATKRLALRATVTRDNLNELKDSLIPTVEKYTNRLMIEHLHTFNGRAKTLRNRIPEIEDFTKLVFDIVPKAEMRGVNTKVLPLDHLRAGGPNDKMTFLNVLPNAEVVVSNAVIYPEHPDFKELKIGNIDCGNIIYDRNKNAILRERYLKHYRNECTNCIVRSICRGSLQRYLFITNDKLGEWDNLRCRYFISIIKQWLRHISVEISKVMDQQNVKDGYIHLDIPEKKIHYPMFLIKNGLRTRYESFNGK